MEKELEINTLQEFAQWVSENNFENFIRIAIGGHFDQWIPSLPIGEAYENAFEDLWEITFLVDFSEVKFNILIKDEILKWCDEKCGYGVVIS